MPVLGKPVPTVKGIPLLGEMFPLLANHMALWREKREKYGDVLRAFGGPPGMRVEFYAVSSATGVEEVLNGDIAVFRKEGKGYNTFRELGGDGILNSQDERYLRQRRLVHPLFTNRTVDTYCETMCEEVSRHIATWGEAVVDVHEAAAEISLQTVMRTMFGNDGIEDVLETYRRVIPHLSRTIVRRTRQPQSIPLSWPTPANNRVSGYRDELWAAAEEIIDRRMTTPDPTSTRLVNLLISARDGGTAAFDLEELRDIVLSFLVMGREHTANSLGFALHMLGKHPDVQDRCRAEVTEQLGDRTPHPFDLVHLPYLTRVLKESMRLYPSVPQTERVPTTDVVIDGFHIPAGSSIIVAPHVTHRHPDYWPDPDRFDPDRFLPEREAERPRYAYFPFGGGTRVCFAQYYSMLQCVLGLALILRDYRIDAVDQEVPTIWGVSLIPTGPMRCQVTPLRG